MRTPSKEHWKSSKSHTYSQSYYALNIEKHWSNMALLNADVLTCYKFVAVAPNWLQICSQVRHSEFSFPAGGPEYFCPAPPESIFIHFAKIDRSSSQNKNLSRLRHKNHHKFEFAIMRASARWVPRPLFVFLRNCLDEFGSFGLLVLLVAFDFFKCA